MCLEDSASEWRRDGRDVEIQMWNVEFYRLNGVDINRSYLH
jgi:hypothetical protein